MLLPCVIAFPGNKLSIAHLWGCPEGCCIPECKSTWGYSPAHTTLQFPFLTFCWSSPQMSQNASGSELSHSFVSATLFKFCVVCRFAEDVICVIIHVVNEDVGKYEPQYWPLGVLCLLLDSSHMLNHWSLPFGYGNTAYFWNTWQSSPLNIAINIEKPILGDEIFFSF